MRQRKYIATILIFVTILSVLLPFIFRSNTESINDTISIVAVLIGSFASLLTLLIAIILFNKFGIETSLLERNTEVVFSLLEEFKKISFIVSGENYALMIRPHDSFHKHFEKYYKEQLVFSVNYAYSLEKLSKISESPFMPKNIYNKVSKLSFITLVIIEEENISKYATVMSPGDSLIGAKYGLFNQTEMTLLEFLNMIDDLRTEIISWIEKNSSYPLDLNI
ncbi:MAG: hypothetical protein LBT43_02155 [Prevotella sp.]|jgi:hypothetical protein|nr:hypothetical protein [Prevotella sp.]